MINPRRVVVFVTVLCKHAAISHPLNTLAIHRIPYPPEATILLAPDSDCCKIFTDSECELLQRVPPAAEAISMIGSTDPAAMLFDAATAFEEGDPRADEVSRTMIG